jgi:hypothetical protein
LVYAIVGLVVAALSQVIVHYVLRAVAKPPATPPAAVESISVSVL